MNLEKIKSIVNSPTLNDDAKQYLIIQILSEDENVIPDIIKILDAERRLKKEILNEMNMQLSRAEIGLEDPKFNKDNFMGKEIIEFYKKYKDVVQHCFKSNINDEKN